MGRQLYDTQPLFRQTLEQCNEILLPYLERSLLDIIYAPETEELGDRGQVLGDREKDNSPTPNP
nr:hypothetical protein [Phormidium sp. LEGE 05292]